MAEGPDMNQGYSERLLEDDVQGGFFAGKGKLIAGALVLLVALGYFGFMAFQSASVYYYTVSELHDVGPTPENKLVRVNGKLIEPSFIRADGSTLANFEITDGAKSMHATYDGVLPDLFFNDHSEIILEGTFGPDGVFTGQNVIVKCPSKYVEQEESGETQPADYT
ncbi:MAG: cytochrome c maturation protein CcmE [Chloroflexi bacterium]|nr:cytochrome c maturation protein CcmE [Chloroflexota bacterium]MDA1227451.1 cytochrome c maturation protein CcmE [Chloroflexota bacterium]